MQQHYRIQYYQFIDRISVEMKKRFSSDNDDSDLATYKILADIIKTGKVPQLVKSCPELDSFKLSIQISKFKQQTGASSVYEARKSYQLLSTYERGLYPQVLQLLKILLVCPISSSACERSFSTLRRLKTWLRNRMGQERLNSNIVCQRIFYKTSTLKLFLMIL